VELRARRHSRARALRRTGGATPLEGDDLATGAAKATAVREMFDRIAPRYDLVNRVMTLGVDLRWRRRAVRALALSPGALVLDVATGTGDLCEDLARAGQRPVGVDFSMGMLAARRTTAPVVQADALSLPVPDERADGLVCGFALRNLADLPAFFAECARVLRPGGRLVLLDAAEPQRRPARAVHRWYFGTVVPRLGSLLSDRDAYRYLPRSLAYLPPPADLLARLGDAGFVAVERRQLSWGAAQLLTGTRRP
jgi:demethylmenaquinone methyltransferase/2-methoxy-6-polyprenyl-1,4-benzoquinol methylase